MRTRRDARASFGQNVQVGAAMGVGAFLGAALVTLVMGVLASRLPFVVKVLPKAPAPGDTTP